MMWHYYNGPDWLVMAGLMFVFWGGAIALIAWAYRTFAGPSQGSDPAIDALRQRLGSGQLSRDQFENTRKAIKR